MEKTVLRAKAKKYGVPIIRTESHEILQNFVKEKQPKHILEIGTAIGFSAISMLEVCDGDILTIEHNKDYINQAKANLKRRGLSKRCKIIEGDCLVVLANLVADGFFDNYFDFIFLDGPKAQYQNMLELLLILLKDEGVFVCDNVLFRGYVENGQKAPTKRFKTIIKRLGEFIETCKSHEKLTDFKLIQVEDGMIFARKVKNEK